ncbi:unnamed protein product [Adineta steineri]|uniref:Uncharacterized protein n=1 Tax=Adineta steineri TaxID=433720 RepID=A0A814ZE17_9BILA|nr:unnamed protein product [Adineta steineri]CAF1240688.1 unnamed protein product [Adineta steineri]CAF1447702.1 unnamed protein product [Adineta steineri]CAF3723044.1 unnamed protein product [Adineta steineri]CAF4070511.1 unnamed protein product [Adineta steineri]
MPTIIWLDTDSNNPSNSFLIKLNDYQDVQTFTNIDQCISYIKCHPEQIIFLIVPGTFGAQIVPEIYELSSISMIFVFCSNMKAHIDWAIDFSDKLSMFDHEDDLLQNLWSEIENYSREQSKQYIKFADECKERSKQLQQSCG